MPPFDKVKAKHFMPAFERAFADNIDEIDAIAGGRPKPTVANTIEALERGGRTTESGGSVGSKLTCAHLHHEPSAIDT